MDAPQSTGRSFLAARLFLAALCLAVLLPAAARAGTINALIPAYVYPAGAGLTAWNSWIGSASQIPETIIADPGNGPGTSVESNYASVMQSATSAGATVIGYIATGYDLPSFQGSGYQTLAMAESQVNTWYSLYPEIKGIFIDQMSTTTNSGTLNYYTQLYSYIKSGHPQAVVVGNPGTNFPQAYLAAADSLLSYENDNVASPYANFNPSSFSSGYTASRFSSIIYNVGSQTTMLQDVQLAQKDNVGYLYVTNLSNSAGNPYSAAPSYWSAEVSALAAAIEPGTYAWSNSATAWSSTASWGGTAPASGDIALFNRNSAYTSLPNINTAGLAAGALYVIGSGAVTVGGTNTLTLNGVMVNGNSATGIELDAGAGSLTINAPLVLGGAQQWLDNSGLLTVSGSVNLGGHRLIIAGSGRTSIGGPINGTGGLELSGGSLVLSGSDGYGGGTFVDAGTLKVMSPSALPTGGNLTVGVGATFTSVSPAEDSPLEASPEPASAPVPEPSTLASVVAGVVILAAYRRSQWVMRKANTLCIVDASEVREHRQ